MNNTPISTQLYEQIPAPIEWRALAEQGVTTGFGGETNGLLECSVQMVRFAFYLEYMNTPGVIGNHEKAVTYANKMANKVRKIVGFNGEHSPNW